MSRRPRAFPVDRLIAEIDQKLKQLALDLPTLSLREKVLKLVDANHSMADLGVSVAASDGITATAAMDRIAAYLVRHVGIVIDGEELAVVAGVSDYPRRTRQLRKERGYRILTGASCDEDSEVTLRPDQYLLTSAELDGDAARRWHVANRIRREDLSMMDKMLKYLQENLHKVVTTEELAYVANLKGGSDFTRRIRQLRTEKGFAIATRVTGRPDLRVGEYVLLSKDRVAEEHDRHISADTQKEVYKRDNNTCRIDGWNQSRWTPEDPRILELHHLIAHADGGENNAKNLIVLCSRCHDLVHAGKLTIPPEVYP